MLIVAHTIFSKANFILLIVLLATQLLNAQELRPSKTHALVKIVVMDPDHNNAPLMEQMSLVGKKSDKVYSGKSNTQGELKLLLPIDDTYILSFTDAKDYVEIPVKNAPMYVLKVPVLYTGGKKGTVHPNINNIVANICYLDLKGVGVPNEEITIVQKSNKKAYKAVTNTQGCCQIQVPRNDSFSVNFKYYPNIRSFSSFDTDEYLLKYHALPSLEWKRRDDARKQAEAKRDLEWKTQRMEYEARVLRDDPIVFKTLEKNKQWKNPLIVIDVTGSMSPYINQVKLWFDKYYVKNNIYQVAVFSACRNNNLGQWGGVLFGDNMTPKKLDSLIQAGESQGCSDENDIEALVKSIKKFKGFSHVILIGDNSESVNDIAYLPELVKLNIPVNVIVCGNNGYINEEFLNIANSTKGIIHLMEQDIPNLDGIPEGKELTIGQRKYIKRDGRFICINF